MNHPQDERIARLTVNENESIKTTVQAIDNGALGIAIIVNDDDRFVGLVTDGDIRKSIDKTRKEWITYHWDGECPIYADPIGFKNHLEKKGWKNMSTKDEPYLIDPQIAQQLMRNYKQFLKIKAQRRLHNTNRN